MGSVSADVRSPRTGARANDGFVPIPPRVLKFAYRNAMKVVQINAQRLYGPPYNVLEYWEPEYGSEIFIGRIPRSFHEPELMPFLEKGGPVFQLRLMMDFSGKTNKGFCFVRYFSAYQADVAVTILNGLEIRQGRPIFAMKSVDNRKLLLSGLPTYRSYNEIVDRVMSISEGVIFVHALWAVPTYHERGIAIVTYESHRTAALARKRMMGKPVYFWEYQISVDWAEPDSNLNGIGSAFANRPQILCLRNYPLEVRVRTFRKLFNEHSFGGVKRLRVSHNQIYVFFRSRIQGEAAKLALNGAMLGNNILSVDWIDPKDVPLSRRQKLKLRQGSQLQKVQPQRQNPQAQLQNQPAQQPDLQPQQQDLQLQQPDLLSQHQDLQPQQDVQTPQQDLQPIQEEVQKEAQEEVQKEAQKEVQKEAQKEVQKGAQKEVQKGAQKEVQKEAQEEAFQVAGPSTSATCTSIVLYKDLSAF